MSDALETYAGRVRSTSEFKPWLGGNTESDPVLRDGEPVSVTYVSAVLSDFLGAHSGVARGDRPATDEVLAPKIHSALRLTRAEASDRGMWCWLAVNVAPDYVKWRWEQTDATVADNRWIGEIHKQALARLWWGAELFRDGPNYMGAVFQHQDIANSIIHRTFVRSRPLAVALPAVLADKVPSGVPPKGPLRKWFSDINLYAGARNLDALGLLFRNDATAYRSWVNEGPQSGKVEGPDDGRVPDEAIKNARELLELVWASGAAHLMKDGD